MSAQMFCKLICDGCGELFSLELFNSVSEAQAAAWEQKWATQKVFNRLFDFCPVCQAAGKQETPRERTLGAQA